MTEFGTEALLQGPIQVENDFDVDDDGISYILNNVYVAEEEHHEIKVRLDEVTCSFIDLYGDVKNFDQPYIIAHALSRVAEIPREKAINIEDSVSPVKDLFDIDDE